jgi:DNA polymerase-3 subunit chi
MKVDFHTRVTDKLGHACRLLRKSQAAGAQVVVCGDRELLDRLDTALWTFDALSFVPHARLRGATEPGHVLSRSPVWLADEPRRALHRMVLVNLGPGMAPGWQEFERVIEIVQGDDDDSAQGRRRWREYAGQAGVELVNHSGAGAA